MLSAYTMVGNQDILTGECKHNKNQMYVFHKFDSSYAIQIHQAVIDCS